MTGDLTIPAPDRTYLVWFQWKDENTGVSKDFGIEVIDGKMVGSGDLEPDQAAQIFFDYFKGYAGEEFMKLAAEKFNQRAAT